MKENPVNVERRGVVGLLLVDRPPVNAIDVTVRKGLHDGVLALQQDSTVEVILIACPGRTFMSGADLTEFDTGVAAPDFRQTLGVIEQSRIPVIAAMHGTVFGAGLEVAMACHYRVAVGSTKMGLPEITLGVVPGAGATQRLPRLIGALPALKMLISAVPVDAAAAVESGLIDEVISGDPVEAGVAYARDLAARKKPPRRTRDRNADTTGYDNESVQAVLAANTRALKGRTTQHSLLEAVKAATQLPLEAGLDVEKRLSDASLETTESRALRHVFFAERGTARVPGVKAEIAPLEINNVAIVGAGTMGSGIAIALGNAGYKVTLIDAHSSALDRGRQIIAGYYEGQAKRGRMSAEKAQTATATIATSLQFESVGQADLVIEAVFEDLELKKKIFSQLDSTLPQHAILASNTSSLSISELASITDRADRIVGLHFFSPAHIMKLLEIVRGNETSPQTLVTALEVGRKLKKIPVVSGDQFGFIGNKMMLDGSFREGEQLMLEGASVEQIDSAMEAAGFAMGQSKVNDMAGIDVGTFVRQQLFKKETRPDPYCVVSDALTPMGRIGQKVGKGFYDYSKDPRAGAPDPEVESIIRKLAAERGIAPRQIEPAEIVERCMLQLINVGAELLEKGIAYRAADIDIVWVYGYGFPRHLGGPLFYADTLGLKHVLERIRYWGRRNANYWTPSGLIEKLARDGSTFANFDRLVAAK